jgi:hypothetical protein
VGEGIGAKPAFVHFYSSRSHGVVRLHPPLATATAAGVTVFMYVLLRHITYQYE